MEANNQTVSQGQANPGDVVQDDSELFRQLFEPSTDADAGTTGSADGAVGSQAASDEFFIKGATTVYKTAEAAVAGINEKDRVIAELQGKVQTLESATGPGTGQPNTQTVGQEDASYMKDSDAYVKGLQQAAETGDTAAYRDTQVRLLEEVLSPYLPALADLSKARAQETIGAEFKGFDEFSQSEDYKTVLTANPVLSEAIQAAEVNPQLSTHLSGLYRLAYLTSQGLKAAELSKAAFQQGAESQPSGTLGTDTQKSVNVTPGAVTSTVDFSVENATSKERSARIKAFENSGILDKKF